MGHNHDHGAMLTTATAAHRKRLAWALAITLTVMIAEVIGAVISGSLALLADAAHMLTDSFGIAMALAASWLATRPATEKHTFGWLRLEILAALVNGLILSVLCIVVLLEGIRRLGEPPQEIEGPTMLVVAAVGLMANIISLLILRAGQKESLNVRGAYLEVLGDALGSVAVIGAGVIILTTGWLAADAWASIVIAVLIAPRAWSLLRDVIAVLLESTPAGVNLTTVRQHIEAIPQVQSVHDLHAWTITSGVPVLSAHVVTTDDADPTVVLSALHECLGEHFDVAHCTFQLEPGEQSCDRGTVHA